MKTFRFILRTIILLMCFNICTANAQYSIDSRIRASSVLIQTPNGTGSGFLVLDTVKMRIYLVTASHVLVNMLNRENPIPDTISFVGYRDNVDVDSIYRFKIALKRSVISGDAKFDIDNDVAVIKLASVIDSGSYGAINYPSYVQKVTKGTKIESWPGFLNVSLSDVIPGSDMFIIGFPQSLSLQGNFDMNRPLMRKGIIAGKDMKLNRIIGDGAVYFGNSGGIAVAIHSIGNEFQLRLAGLVSQFIPFDESLYDKRGNQRSVDYRNSGYSVIIPSDFILRLIATFR